MGVSAYSDMIARAKERSARESQGGATIDGKTGALLPGGDEHTEGGGNASPRTRARRKTFSQTVAETTRDIDTTGGVHGGKPPDQQEPNPKVGGDVTSKSTFIKAEAVDAEHGIVFGWGIICTENGKPYIDVQKDHIPEAAMLDAAADFCKAHRPGNEMHAGPETGQYLFMFPMTTEIAKAFGIETSKTGLMLGYKPPAAVLAKFKSGEYTGFSIEGDRILDKAVES